MVNNTPPENTGEIQVRNSKGTFEKGQSGNPSGKPKGARNKATRAAEVLLDNEAETLTRKAIELALQGNIPALRLCLERVMPPRRDMPINISLPKLERTFDALKALAAVLESVAGGELGLREGEALAGMIESFRRTIETEELEKRLIKLEEKQNDQS